MDPSHDASKVKAEGPGLSRTGKMPGHGWTWYELGLGLIGPQALTALSWGGLPGVEVGKPTHFTVLTKGAGKAKLDVHFAGAAKGEAVRDFEIIDNHDYSYTVKYTAVQQVCLIRSCLSLCYRWDLNITSSASSDPFWALAHFLSPARSCSRTMNCSVQGGVTGVYRSHPILTFSFTQ